MIKTKHFFANIYKYQLYEKILYEAFSFYVSFFFSMIQQDTYDILHVRSVLFRTKRNSVWCHITRKTVITIQFRDYFKRFEI